MDLRKALSEYAALVEALRRDYTELDLSIEALRADHPELFFLDNQELNKIITHANRGRK